MIINLRGLNGSGKSTIVHKVMDQCEIMTEIAYPEKNKRKPMGNICLHGVQRLFVPGHYRIPNGGIDTIHEKMEYIYKLILQHHELGADVLYEGKNLSEGLQALKDMSLAGLDVRIVYIDHPKADCIQAVRDRNHNIRLKTFDIIERKYQKQFAELAVSNILWLRLTRDVAYQTIIQWLWGGMDARTESQERLSGIR
jgi:hypothetical protein